jgi:uncharacterized protein (TIGR03083 family)
MNPDDVWRGIDDQRRRLVDLLEDLSDQEWQHPSLCEGWSVRQVAAHVALQHNASWSAMPRAVLETIKAGGLNGAIHAMACQHAQLPTERIIAEIRERIGIWRPPPTITHRGVAIDTMVHLQDIAIPIGRDVAMPVDVAAVAAGEVCRSSRMFHARRRFTGYRFVATDTEWSAGRGREVTGPIGAILLLLTGRRAGLDRLTGPGADAARAALGARP